MRGGVQRKLKAAILVHLGLEGVVSLEHEGWRTMKENS